MEKSSSKSEKSMDFAIAIFLIGAGIISLLLNFVYLPWIGVFIGIPFILAGIFFLVKHNRRYSETDNPPETR